MNLLLIFSSFSATSTENNAMPAWFMVAFAAMAGTLTHKQLRKLKWKLAWYSLKKNFKKGKSSKKLTIGGILLILAIVGLTVWIISLGGGLLLLGVVLLVLAFSAAERKTS